MIEVGMREAGMTLKDPRLRAVDFAERARLEGGLVGGVELIDGGDVRMSPDKVAANPVDQG